IEKAHKTYERCPVARNKLAHILALRSLYATNENIFDSHYISGSDSQGAYSNKRKENDLQYAYTLLQDTFELLAEDNIVNHSDLFDISRIFINPKNLMYYDTFAFILHCLKKFGLALKISSECFEVDPFNSRLHFHYGIFAELMDNNYKAIYHFKKSIISGHYSLDNFCAVASYSNLRALSNSADKLKYFHFSSVK
ncbi:MAG: hypothetical protein ACW97P_13120, partial [Candidatus Hodarchaeales archaeon]